MLEINCDMGEGFGVYSFGFDQEAVRYVDSVNLACGFHASDPVTMRQSVRLAKSHNVLIGAHPSYPDLVGFGRRNMRLSTEEIECIVLYQTGALMAMCAYEGVRMSHVKPHGALYNMAAEEVAVALAIARAIKRLDKGLYMICLANSRMVEAARHEGILYKEEAFADRLYNREGALVPRGRTGAVISDIDAVVRQSLMIAQSQRVITDSGEEIVLRADTLCLHSDTPEALDMLKAVHNALTKSPPKG